jgi:hypothetical protein
MVEIIVALITVGIPMIYNEYLRRIELKRGKKNK